MRRPAGLDFYQSFDWFMPEQPPQTDSLTEGCWDWRGHTAGCGYGQIECRTPGQRYVRNAHVVSYEFFIGPVPPGLFVLHSCDRKPCVQPFHLHVGTHTDNMREARERVEFRARRRILTDEQVAFVLASRLSERRLALLLGVSHTTIGDIRRHS